MMSINHAGVEVAVHESQRYSLTKISANHPSVARGLVRWQFVALKFAVAERPFIGHCGRMACLPGREIGVESGYPSLGAIGATPCSNNSSAICRNAAYT